MLQCYNVTMLQCSNVTMVFTQIFSHCIFSHCLPNLILPLTVFVVCLFVCCGFSVVSVVLLYVFFKIVILCESLLADIALKVLYTAMDLHVLSQVAFLG